MAAEKRRRGFRQFRRGGEVPRQRPHLGDHQLRRAAAVARELAPDQIVGLNACGALVDRRDARIPQELRCAGLLDESDAAMHLYP